MAFVSKCSRSYHKTSNAKVSAFATKIEDGYFTNNTLFPVKVITALVFAGIKATYASKYAAYEQGGIAQKADFVTAKTAIMTALDEIATAVDAIAAGVTGTITAAGYNFTKDKKPAVVKPPQAGAFVIKALKGKGILQTEIGVLNDYGTIRYTAICVEGAALKTGQLTIVNDIIMIDATVATNAIRVNTSTNRKKKFTGLTPGTEYFMYYFFSNSKGSGDLSNYVSLTANSV